MWDDHDYGEDDAGGEYPMKDASRRLFLDFWGEPADSPRRTRDGVYAAYLFGPPGERVQVILPDLRYNRTALVKTPIASEAYESWAKARAPYWKRKSPPATGASAASGIHRRGMRIPTSPACMPCARKGCCSIRPFARALPASRR